MGLALLVPCVVGVLPPVAARRLYLVDLVEFPLGLAYRLGLHTRRVVAYRRLAAELEHLRGQVAVLRAKAAQYDEVAQENARLREVLALGAAAPYTVVTSRVIAKDPTSWSTAILIDKGAEDRIHVEMPVLAQGALIGQVVEVGRSTSKVRLLTDPGSRIAAMVQRSREQGLLVGTGEVVCRLAYLPIEGESQPEDLVVSSGLGGRYPKGLPLGAVVTVDRDPGRIYQIATVKPLADLAALEEVQCVEAPGERVE